MGRHYEDNAIGPSNPRVAFRYVLVHSQPGTLFDGFLNRGVENVPRGIGRAY